MGKKKKDNIFAWLPSVMRRYGLVLVIIIAIPPTLYLGQEAVPELFRPMVFADRPQDSAVRAGLGPEDARRRIEIPEYVKGIYLTSATVGHARRFGELMDLVERTELNAMVIDVKNWRGELAFAPNDESLVPYAAERPEMVDLDAMTAMLKEKGIYLIARIFVFQDPSFAEKRPELAVQRVGGGLWRDWRGVLWLDPAAKGVWKYNVAVAKEVFNRGFDEVQFDYIRFPSDGPMSTIVYPSYDGETPKHEVMRQFFTYLDRELRVRNGIPTSVDLFGLTMWNFESDMGIGQRLVDAAPHFDFISPMVYPSHYPTGYLGYANPAAHPYEIIYSNMVKGVELIESIRDASADPDTIATVRPWLQDFDLGANYDRAKIIAQMDATAEGGGSGWIFWNARNVYTESAFAPAEDTSNFPEDVQ